MLMDFTWDIFEKTGNIETFLEYYKLKNGQVTGTGEENGGNNNSAGIDN